MQEGQGDKVEVKVEVKVEEGEGRGKAMAEPEAKSAAIKRAKKLMLPKDLPAKYDHAQWRAKHGKDAGTAELQPYHRAKLRALLTSLLQEHLYSAASGPACVLLQAHTREDVYQNRDLQYFWVRFSSLSSGCGTCFEFLRDLFTYALVRERISSSVEIQAVSFQVRASR
jgi:hypothetical protein